MLFAAQVAPHPCQQALHGNVTGKIASLLFSYLDFIGSLWSKSFQRDVISGMVKAAGELLADLEAYLLAWELDINRHMLLQIVTAIEEWGPPWVWSAFGYERLWGRMCEWLLNKARPEASIMLSIRALKVAVQYLSSSSGHFQAEEDESETVSLYHTLVSFDRGTHRMVVPGYLQEAHSTAVHLCDGGAWKPIVPTPARAIKATLSTVWPELHLFYLRYPSKCKKCQCAPGCECPDYAALWAAYVQTVRRRPATTLSLQVIAELLPGWATWAKDQGLSNHQVQLCHGPGPIQHPIVQLFDRLELGCVKLTGSKQESKLKAKNSVVMIHDGRKYQVGRVRRFFAHTSPGHSHVNDAAAEDVEGRAQNADVDWYAETNRSVPGAPLGVDAMDSALDCPVVRRGHVKDIMGNFWACEGLVRCKLALILAPHPRPNRKGDMIVIARHADFAE